jgi:hypothetical protein
MMAYLMLLGLLPQLILGESGRKSRIPDPSYVCPICNYPVQRGEEIVFDFWKNVYHVSHWSHFQHCYSCGRLIHPGVTGTSPFMRGGKRHLDGREVCNVCIKSGSLVFYPVQAEKILQEVLTSARRFGIDIPDIYNIALVDEKEMAAMRERELRPGEQNPAMTSLQISKSLIQQQTTVETKCTIYILTGLHEYFFRECLAHELMHAWIFVNCQYELVPPLREGTCNYLAYRFLQQQRNSAYKKYYIFALETNTDPVYGDGFQKVKQLVNDFGDFATFLQYLRYNSDFPKTEGGL